MASGPAAPRHNLEALRARFGRSAPSASHNAAGQSSQTPTASGSKFAFRDPNELKTSSSSKPPAPAPQQLKRNATSAGLNTRTSPAKSAPTARAPRPGHSAPNAPPPATQPSFIHNNNKGKGRAVPQVDDSGFEEEDLEEEAFWPDPQQLAEMDEMEAEAVQFERENRANATRQLSPPPPPSTASAREEQQQRRKPLSPNKNRFKDQSAAVSTAASAARPPSSSNSSTSRSTNHTSHRADESIVSSSSSAEKIQAELDKAQKQKDHFQKELLDCVTTGSCDSGMESSFLEQLLKGVNLRMRALQDQLAANQESVQSDTSRIVERRSASPLADVLPPAAAAAISNVRRPQTSTTTSRPAPMDEDDPFIPDSAHEEDQDLPMVPEPAPPQPPRPAPPHQSDDFDHLYSDLDAADLDHLEVTSSLVPQPRKSTPKKTTAGLASAANASKSTIVIDDSDDDADDAAEDQSALSRHFQKAGPSASAATAATTTGSTKSGPDPRLSQHPWSRDVFKALSQVFKLPGFRKNQLEAINGALGGQDVFVLMPTGGGKSLCYQLPAVVHSGRTKGITIVISPLISLIQDQINALVAKGISALPFNGDMDRDQRDFVLGEMRSRDPTVGLIYVTPEMVGMLFLYDQALKQELGLILPAALNQLSSSAVFATALERLHGNKRLARFVVDEAHCISTWGHDYRPAYKELDKLKNNFPDIPTIALTATANTRVRQDVISNLGLKSPVVLTQSFNRTNLHYEVRPKGKGFMEQIATFIKRDHAGECGIIYCLSKKNCEDVAAQLRSKHGVKAMHYHAGMDKNDRKRVQLDWQSGKLLVICATIAFGMGIDKENCRFVVHHSLPKSLEGYYQETGRAGRDGKPSVCILYYSYSDSHSIARLIDMGDGSHAQKDRAKAELRNVVSYCMNTTDCRRAQVLNYFGELFDPQLCGGACDICAAGPQGQAADVTEYAKKAVQLVKNLTEPVKAKVTLVYCVDVFRGSRAKKILDQYHDEVEGYAEGSSLERGDTERLFQVMVNCEILREVAQQTGSGFSASYLATGKHADAVLKGKRSVSMHLSTPKPQMAAPSKAPKSAATGGLEFGKTKVVGRSRRANQATWDSDGDDEFIDSDEDAERTSRGPPRQSTSVDASETRYATLLAKSQQITKKQPALADMLTEEVLQEMVLMSPSSVEEVFGFESLSQWPRKDLVSNRKVFQDLLSCAQAPVAAARSRAVKQLSGFAFQSAEDGAFSSASGAIRRKSSNGSGGGAGTRRPTAASGAGRGTIGPAPM